MLKLPYHIPLGEIYYYFKDNQVDTHTHFGFLIVKQSSKTYPGRSITPKAEASYTFMINTYTNNVSYGALTKAVLK